MKVRRYEKYYEKVLQNDYLIKQIIILGTKRYASQANRSVYYGFIQQDSGDEAKKVKFLAYDDLKNIEGEALLIEIDLGLDDKMEFLIPRKSQSKNTWKSGLEKYNKYIG